LQTQPRPDPAQDENLLPKSRPPSSGRWLNLGLAVVGAGVYLAYVIKDWPERTLVLGLGLVLFGGLLTARLYIGFGKNRLLQIFGLIIKSERFWVGLLLVLIVGLGLGVRVLLIDPKTTQSDPETIADRALFIIQTGNFDPTGYYLPNQPTNPISAFATPSLSVYLQTGAFAFYFLQGVAADRYDGTSALENPIVRADFTRWGQNFTALLGAATIGLVFWVTTLYYSSRAGLVAAFFLSLSYLHVRNSGYISTEIPAGLFALLPFLLLWPILQGKTQKWHYIGAGFLVGLAAGVIYANILLILPLLLAYGLSRSPQKWLDSRLFLAMLGISLGFLVATPFAFWHLPEFLTGLAGTPIANQNSWSSYINALASRDLTVSLLGVGGIALAFARHQRRDVVLLAFPLAFLLQLAGHKGDFSQNILPFVPFLVIFAALGLVEGVAFFLKKWQPHRQNVLIAGLSLLAVVTPILTILTGGGFKS